MTWLHGAARSSFWAGERRPLRRRHRLVVTFPGPSPPLLRKNRRTISRGRAKPGRRLIGGRLLNLRLEAAKRARLRPTKLAREQACRICPRQAPGSARTLEAACPLHPKTLTFP